ncbi:MAG: cytochrome C [Ignavibacteriales bacterium]|nr:cytochrome C [Ignavibacteriales bacterium]
MKLKYFYLIIIFSVAGFITFSAFASGEDVNPGNGNEKIIKFSHAVHSEATDCKGCHSKVSDSKSLNDRLLPDHTECSQCHDVQDEKTCNTCHFDNKFEPLNQTKSQMIFNHSFHINEKKMECEICHTGLKEVDYSFKAVKAMPQMETCYQCHNNEQGIATNECEACHLSTANLIPQNHQTSNYKKTHKFAAEANDANCAMCHDNNSCAGCHVGTNMLTEKNTAKDFYAPYSPHNFVDGTKQQKITRVHDLNFTYTHGIDLKGKESECQTCHQAETFCAECHNLSGGDYAIAGVMPTSHKAKDFMIIGVGSGGGQHATEAKRDIERCASCHDTQGGDPACITCHFDSDGIKGTNPKTHPNGFMRDEQGDWHNDSNSLCFNCHISTNSPGVGFCGYCHSSKRD